MFLLLAWFLQGWALTHLLLRRAPSVGAMLAVGLATGALAQLLLHLIRAPLYLQISIQGILAFCLCLAVMIRRGNAAAMAGIRLPRHQGPKGLGREWPSTIIALLPVILGVWLLVRLAGVPPAMFDVLSYHLPIASAFNDPETAARVLREPLTFYERLPLAASILQAPFVSQQSGGIYAPTLHLFLILSVLAAAGCAARITRWLGCRRPVQFLAFAAVLLHPITTDTVMKSLQEPLMGLMALAAFELLLQGFAANRRERWALLLSGLVGGTAGAMKLSAVGVTILPLMMAFAVLAIASRAGMRRTVTLAALAALGGLLTQGPWLLRSYLVGGHPLHPFAGFSEAWTAEQARFVLEVHQPIGLLSVAWFSAAVTNMGKLGYPMMGSSTLLLFAVVAVACTRGGRGIPLLAGALVAYGAFLGVRHNPDRFLYGGALLLVPLAASAAGRFGALGRRVAVPVMAALLCLASLQTVRNALAFDPVYRPHYREALLGAYVGEGLPSMAAIASDQAVGGTLLLFFETRPSLFRGKVESRTVWDQASYADDLKAAADDEDFARRLLARGVTTIFVNEAEWGRFIDFYAPEARRDGMRAFGRIGLSAAITNEERIAALAAYPPHQFSKLGSREIAILDTFLRQLRRTTMLATAAGEAEIWTARIPPVDLP